MLIFFREDPDIFFPSAYVYKSDSGACFFGIMC